VTKIADLETEIAQLKGQTQADQGLRAQVAAKDQALGAKLGLDEQDMGRIPVQAWGLAYAEYFHRTKQYNFIGTDSKRAKLDRYANRWTLENRRDLIGLESLAQAFGYDPENPPYRDYILLKCEPNKGAYDVACVDIEKAQETYRVAGKQIAVLQGVQAEHSQKGRLEKAEAVGRDIDILKAQQEMSASRYNECRAVVENSLQRFYLIPIEHFQRMDEMGMALHCQSLTVVPQKRHAILPEYTPTQVGMIGPDGTTVFDTAALDENRYPVPA
jgi:hypothetical protein